MYFTYYVENYGCQMNVADAQELENIFAANNGIQSDSVTNADIILINTCTVREKAESKALSSFGKLRSYKQEEGYPLMVASGCAIPYQKEELRKRFPYIDLFVDQTTPEMVLEEVNRFLRNPPDRWRGILGDNGFSFSADYEALKLLGYQDFRKDNFVNVQRGCDRFCSFCIVPYVRGREESIPAREIISSIKRKLRKGAKEITLLGQNILSYGKERKDSLPAGEAPPFVELIDRVLAETDVTWLRFLTGHPADLSPQMIEGIFKNERVPSAIHVPVQSGNDRILKTMSRHYTRKEYLEKIKLLRQARKDIYISTDIIVGFPGETEEEYGDTLSLMEEVGFNDAFMFAYSERRGTLAARRYPDTLSRQEKLRRLNRLIEFQRSVSRDVNSRYLGRISDALVEEVDDKKKRIIARTEYNKPITMNLNGREPALNEFIKVKYSGLNISTFIGDWVETGSE